MVHQFLPFLFAAYAAQTAANRLSTQQASRHTEFPALNSTAASSLYRRVLGSRLDNVRLTFVQTGYGHDQNGRPLDSYDIRIETNQMIVAASSGVAAARALGDYLHKVGCDVDRPGKQLACLGTPASPLPGAPMQIATTAKHSIRYNYNVVAHSYSMPFWGTDEWIRELDVIALQGYNAPVLFQGQEFVWAEVFAALGVTEEQLQRFFAGPAFLAWSGPRMGNMRGWMGPLDPAFRSWQAGMAREVLAHARSLGFLPIMPAFAVHVPLALQDLFPDANITRSPYWAGMPEQFTEDGFLEPTDPLFDQIQKNFLRLYNQTMGGLGQPGTPHLFNADSYNEMLPQSNDTEFLASAASRTFGSMAEVDPDAVWVIQGWAFSFEPAFWKPPQIKSFVTGVPMGRMLVLDLAAFKYPIWQETEGFFGQDFVWCVLNNGGGRVGIFGNLTHVAAAVGNATSHGGGMAGVGSSPEGIHDNPVMYRLLADLGWEQVQPTADAIGDWLLHSFVTPRYGLQDQDVPSDARQLVIQGWEALHTAVYNYTLQRDTAAWMFRPGLHQGNLGYWYDASALTDAWRNLSAAIGVGHPAGGDGDGGGPGAANAASASWWVGRPMLLRDVVDVTRQEATTWFEDTYGMAMAAYSENRTESTRMLGALLVEQVKDIDAVLSGCDEFMLGPWVQGARDMAAAVSQAAGESPGSAGAQARERQYVTNAKWLITLWGPVEGTGAVLQSYAQRQWAGIAGTLYASSWGEFVGRVVQANEAGVPLNESAWSRWAMQHEQEWASNASATYPAHANVSLALAGMRSLWARMAGDGGAAALDKFQAHPNSDGYGDLVHTEMQTRQPGQLATLAMQDPKWVGGFNANGWMKSINVSVVPYQGSVLWKLKAPPLS